MLLLPSLALELRVKRIAQTVAEQVENQDHDADHQRGGDQQHRVGVHALDGVSRQRAEGRHGGCNAEAEEAQVALGEDGGRDLQGGGDDQGTHAVGQQVLFDDAAAGCAQCAGSGDILALFQRQDLGADDTRHADPIQQREDDEDGHHIGAEGLHPAEAGLGRQRFQRFLDGHSQQDNEQDVGDGVENIGNAHHDVIDPAARKCGDSAVGRTDEQDQHRGQQADGQGDAGAHHDTHGKVTAHTVGAQNVGEYVLALVDELLLRGRILKRSQVVAALDLLLVAVRPEAGQNVGHEGDQQDDHQADHGDLVFLQAAHAVLPEVDTLTHDNEALLLVVGCGGEIFHVELQAQRILFQIFHFVCSSLLQLDARVDDLVQDVNDDVGNNDEGRQQNRGAHDHHVVTVGDGRHEVTAQAGDGEDLLDDEGTGHQTCQHGADIGDNRQDGVAQGVLEQDLHAGNALGAGGAHVILTHDVQQTGTHQAGDVGGGVNSQRRHGHDVGRRLIQTDGGQNFQIHAEGVKQHDAGNKARDSDAAGGEDNNKVVSPFSSVIRRQTAQRNADAQGDQNGQTGGAGRHRQLGEDDLVDGTAALFQAQAHIAVDKAVHVVEVLHTQGLVQAVFFGQSLLGCFTDGLFRHERAAGDQVHDEKGKGRDDEHAENAHCHALDDVLRHGLVPLRFLMEYKLGSILVYPFNVLYCARAFVRTLWTRKRIKKPMAAAIANTIVRNPKSMNIIKCCKVFVNSLSRSQQRQTAEKPRV